MSVYKVYCDCGILYVSALDIVRAAEATAIHWNLDSLTDIDRIEWVADSPVLDGEQVLSAAKEEQS